MRRAKANNLSYLLLISLMIYMPLHYYICELFLKSIRIDNVVRDFLIVILFFLTTGLKRIKIRRNAQEVNIVFNIIVLLGFGTISFAIYRYPETLNILRTYLIPALMYFIGSRIDINEKKIQKIHNVFIFELAIIGMYGFFQAFFLGDSFLIKLGYTNNGSFLSSSAFYIGGFHGHQRSVGTFISPNIFGCIIAMAVCASLFAKNDNRTETKQKAGMIVTIVLLFGLVASFSRSAILGLFVSLVYYLYINEKIDKKTIKRALKFIALGVIAIIAINIIDQLLLNGLFSAMIASSVNGVINLSDLSAIEHLKDLTEPFEVVINNPFGLGFGNNGPMAVDTTLFQANRVESSVYLMMYETGFVFGILYFVPYIQTIFQTFRNRKYRYYLPAMCCIVCFITYLLLPNVQVFEILFYANLFIGLYNNKDVKRIYSSIML